MARANKAGWLISFFVDEALAEVRPDLYMYAVHFLRFVFWLGLVQAYRSVHQLSLGRYVVGVAGAACFAIICGLLVVVRTQRLFHTSRLSRFRTTIVLLGNVAMTCLAASLVATAYFNGLIYSHTNFLFLIFPVLAILITGSVGSAVGWFAFAMVHECVYAYLWSINHQFPKTSVNLSVANYSLWIALVNAVISHVCNLLLALFVADHLAATTRYADKALNEQRVFMATATHELRTPLMQILGIIELLNDTPLTATQADLLRTLKSSTDGVAALVNDVLDLERIRSSKMKLQADVFELRPLVASVMQLTSLAVVQRGQRVDIVGEIDADVPAKVVGDAVRFRQILQNLVCNACKFMRTNVDGRVVVHVSSVPVGADQVSVEVTVEDNGIGIEPSLLPRIFAEFTQGSMPGAGRPLGGAGLGLAICRSLVTQMGGTISATSSGVDCGACFRFNVIVDLDHDRTSLPATTICTDPTGAVDPVQVDESADDGTAVVVVRDRRPLRVLVVDDNDINLKIVCRFLDTLGDSYVVAHDGAEALDVVRGDDNIDVVITDVMMPVLDGVGFVAQLRQMETVRGRAHLPVYASTAASTMEITADCIRAGADGFLFKPFTRDLLERTLAAVADGLPRTSSISSFQVTAVPSGRMNGNDDPPRHSSV
ncbi:Histidine kinase [Plasmodiophora brassicae]